MLSRPRHEKREVRVPQDWRRQGYSIDAMRALARARLPRPVFDFGDGGAEDEVTLRRNESAFDAYAFVPKPLDGAADRDLSIELFGQRLAMPVIVGPTGLSGLFWPDGERATARAATAAGTAFCLSHGSVCSLEDLAGTGAVPRWMQVFIYRDRGFTRSLVERAKAADYDALVLTTDNQMLGKRERDVRNGFTIPPSFGLADYAAMLTRMGWIWRMRGELGRLTFGNYAELGGAVDITSLAAQMADLLDPAMNWDDVRWLREIWPKPLILKGILSPEEAARAADAGVDAVVVSNHGGRQLDGAIASFGALPAVVDRLDGRIPVLLDGGVRRGTDVLKARSLGATACLVGRPQLWGVAVAGQAGVAHILDIYRRELDIAMGLCGLTALNDVTSDLLCKVDASS